VVFFKFFTLDIAHHDVVGGKPAWYYNMTGDFFNSNILEPDVTSNSVNEMCA
jgi:hypothetical protein